MLFARSSALALILVSSLCLPAFGQASAAPAVPDPLSVAKSILGTTVPTETPSQFVGIGAGYKNGSPSGWVNGGTSIAAGLFLVGAVDFQDGNSATRFGIEQFLFASPHGAIYLTLKADAGLATGASSVGDSYGAGASAVFRLPVKSRPLFLAASMSVSKSDVSVYLLNPKGVGALGRLASGVTWRLGVLGGK